MRLRSSILHHTAGIGFDRPSTYLERLRFQWTFFRAYTGDDHGERRWRLWRLVREPFLLPARVR